MKSDTSRTHGSRYDDEGQVLSLYQSLLQAWNRRNAALFASLFEDDGNTIGYDGSPLNGRAEIQSSLARIFADHKTAAYVAKVRSVRFLTPEVAVLRAVAGMVPFGKSELDPEVNAIQTLVADKKEDGRWLIASFQNTPVAFHGRPEMSESLTEELRHMLRDRPL